MLYKPLSTGLLLGYHIIEQHFNFRREVNIVVKEQIKSGSPLLSGVACRKLRRWQTHRSRVIYYSYVTSYVSVGWKIQNAKRERSAWDCASSTVVKKSTTKYTMTSRLGEIWSGSLYLFSKACFNILSRFIQVVRYGFDYLTCLNSEITWNSKSLRHFNSLDWYGSKLNCPDDSLCRLWIPNLIKIV
jgi:hypothetical protein